MGGARLPRRTSAVRAIRALAHVAHVAGVTELDPALTVGALAPTAPSAAPPQVWTLDRLHPEPAP